MLRFILLNMEHLICRILKKALNLLSADQREAIILIGASGFSYEDAAAICGCAVGTIKSRVSRARHRLQELLHVDGESDYGPDSILLGVHCVHLTAKKSIIIMMNSLVFFLFPL